MKWLSVLVLLVIGCTGGQIGPVEITLDRDKCDRCQMTISDKYYAAQVRGGPKNKVFLFDDIGCAMHWLNKQSWGDNAKIWVADYKTGDFLDASTAQYVPEQITPMDFGFGATSVPTEKSIDFNTLKPKLFAKKHGH
ncbi:nitrous oxide reductase accessory protein NosL [Thiotrichales bacterium HSG1]|nr:nitrous oxide reductase accessory protein NosL [Thiotrichales bacterium HSG1]